MADTFSLESWRPAAEWSAPDSDTIDVWRVDLRVSAADWELLSEDEVQRSKRIIIDAKRDQKAAARARLRTVLARYVQRPPESLAFEYGEHGKPSLADSSDLSFNLSHSEHVGLLAVGSDLVVGADVEYAKDGRSFEEIAKSFFSSPERSALLRLPKEDRAAAFYRAWTRKEAYLKAWGTGLSFASSRFTITYADGEAGELVSTEMPGDTPDRWQFVDLQVEPEFPGALCYERPRRRIRLWA